MTGGQRAALVWPGPTSADNLRRLGKDWRPLQSLTLTPSMDPPLPAPAEPQRSDRQAHNTTNPLCAFIKKPLTALHTRAMCRPPHPCIVSWLAALTGYHRVYIAEVQSPPLTLTTQ